MAKIPCLAIWPPAEQLETHSLGLNPPGLILFIFNFPVFFLFLFYDLGPPELLMPAIPSMRPTSEGRQICTFPLPGRKSASQARKSRHEHFESRIVELEPPAKGNRLLSPNRGPGGG
jgi:hypothetical protein